MIDPCQKFLASAVDLLFCCSFRCVGHCECNAGIGAYFLRTRTSTEYCYGKTIFLTYINWK